MFPEPVRPVTPTRLVPAAFEATEAQLSSEAELTVHVEPALVEVQMDPERHFGGIVKLFAATMVFPEALEATVVHSCPEALVPCVRLAHAPMAGVPASLGPL
jgi:hypothetical protein